MTKLLEIAFARAAELPSAEQDLVAQSLLSDLEAEELWDETFANSQHDLVSLAEEALNEHRGGKTRNLDDLL
jgi:hypothetical protein